MSAELFAKLSKRRLYLEECALHFESEPSASKADHQTASISAALLLGALPSPSRSRDRRSSRIDADFRSVIDRQRSLVDEGGRTFESEPQRKTADSGHDCAATPSFPQRAGPSHEIAPATEPSPGIAEGLGDVDDIRKGSCEHEDSESIAGFLTAAGNRVAWAFPCAEFQDENSVDCTSCQSPPFSIGEMLPFYLRYIPVVDAGTGVGMQCVHSRGVLSLHGPTPREVRLRVAFFLGETMTASQDWLETSMELSSLDGQLCAMPIPDKFWETFIDDIPGTHLSQHSMGSVPHLQSGIAFHVALPM